VGGIRAKGQITTLVGGIRAKGQITTSLHMCAGIIELGSIENTTLDQFDRMFNINVR
jgi:NAD(P)-dependent dehydrogenase (short-subunit alcohol dehydrogenase family)